LFTEDPEGFIKEGSGDGHLCIRAPLGNLQWGPMTGDSEREMKDGCRNGSSLYGSCASGTWREDSFPVYPEG